MKRKGWIIGAGVVLLLLAAGTLSALRPGPSSNASGEPSPNVVTGSWVRTNNVLGVAGKDARQSDFSQLNPADVERLTFDSKTQWPERSKLPAGFDPQRVLTEGMDPGLGLRQLHQQGITGKGLSVAMIDKYILPDHQELAGHIKYIEVYPDAKEGRTPHFHGMATASILAGANVGVAPDAFLYYFAVPDDSNGFKNYIVALDQILQLNPTLPKEQRIRVVSVSWSPPNKELAKDWTDLIAKANEQGMVVVYSQQGTAADYFATGVRPEGNRNDPNAYDWADWALNGNGNGNRDNLAGRYLGVPASFRTTASVAGPKEYAYWGDSGLSWAIPYFAGLVTLGLQANPDATFDDLYKAINETAVQNAQRIRMVNPAAYIAKVQR